MNVAETESKLAQASRLFGALGAVVIVLSIGGLASGLGLPFYVFFIGAPGVLVVVVLSILAVRAALKSRPDHYLQRLCLLTVVYTIIALLWIDVPGMFLYLLGTEPGGYGGRLYSSLAHVIQEALNGYLFPLLSIAYAAVSLAQWARWKQQRDEPG